LNEVVVGLVVVLSSMLLWSIMPLAQRYESSRARIPGRSREFLYIQDFWTNGPVGDLIALTLVDVAVAIRMWRGDLPSWTLLLAIVVGIVGGIALTTGFYRLATSSQWTRGDWGYLVSTEGGRVPTLGGKVHLGYFLIQASVGIFALVLLFTLNMRGVALGIGLGGAFLYGSAYAADLRRGVLTP